jgi:FKBP-type peptidyl-prolyl cis-trans isomerase 2
MIKKIEKNSIVTLSYKLYDSKGKVVDESYPQQPLILQYGKTKINSNLEKKLLGKTVGDVIELKQKINTKSPTIEMDFDDFAEDEALEFEENQIIELNLQNKIQLFTIEKIDNTTGKLYVKHYNPYNNQTLINKIKIEKIE